MSVKRLTLRVPGSTSNLGPGFDTLGLALGLYSQLTFELVEKKDINVPLINLKGAIARSLPADRSNLIYTVLTNLWKDNPDLLQRVRVTIESDIPLARGLGSSAAAILGSIWAAYALSNRPVDKAKLLAEAAELEGHPDNLAASLFGGLVVSSPSINGKNIMTQQLPWPPEWNTLLVVPKYSLTTKKARSVLPKSVRLQDAVANVQRVALLTSAVINRDEVALYEALQDKLHEPYRESLVPELPVLRKELRNMPVLGCVLSGAGPSILVIVNQRHKAQVLEHLKVWANRPQGPQILDLKVDLHGLQQVEAR